MRSSIRSMIGGLTLASALAMPLLVPAYTANAATFEPAASGVEPVAPEAGSTAEPEAASEQAEGVTYAAEADGAFAAGPGQESIARGADSSAQLSRVAAPAAPEVPRDVASPKSPAQGATGAVIGGAPVSTL